MQKNGSHAGGPSNNKKKPAKKRVPDEEVTASPKPPSSSQAGTQATVESLYHRLLGQASATTAATAMRLNEEEQRRMIAQHIQRQEQQHQLEQQLLAAVSRQQQSSAPDLPRHGLQNVSLIQQLQAQLNAGGQGISAPKVNAFPPPAAAPLSAVLSRRDEHQHLLQGNGGDETTDAAASNPVDPSDSGYDRDDELDDDADTEGQGAGGVVEREDNPDDPLAARKKLLNESFPKKLHRILDEADQEGNSHIITFLPSGTAFSILDSNKFVTKVMPKYFWTNRITSFQRQLNMYGFKRITEGPERGAYFHPFFIKGRHDLIHSIKRKKVTPRPSTGLDAVGVSSYLGGLGGLSGLGAASALGLSGLDPALLALLRQEQDRGAQTVSASRQHGLLGGQPPPPSRQGAASFPQHQPLSIAPAGPASQGAGPLSQLWNHQGGPLAQVGNIEPLVFAALRENEQRRLELLALLEQQQQARQQGRGSQHGSDHGQSN
jgi:hypothetical protein